MGPLGRVRLSALMERSVEGGIDQWLSRSTIGAVDRGTWQSELMGVFPAGPMYLSRWPKTLKTALMASLEGTGNQQAVVGRLHRQLANRGHPDDYAGRPQPAFLQRYSPGAYGGFGEAGPRSIASPKIAALITVTDSDTRVSRRIRIAMQVTGIHFVTSWCFLTVMGVNRTCSEETGTVTPMWSQGYRF